MLDDLCDVYKIHRLVGKVDQITPDNVSGGGSVRRCDLCDGNKAMERVFEWDEAKHSYVIDLLDGIVAMESVVVKVTGGEFGSGKSKVICDVSLKAKFGVVGKVMEWLVVKPKLGGAIGDLFGGLEYYEQAGDEIGKGFKTWTSGLVK